MFFQEVQYFINNINCRLQNSFFLEIWKILVFLILIKSISKKFNYLLKTSFFLHKNQKNSTKNQNVLHNFSGLYTEKNYFMLFTTFFGSYLGSCQKIYIILYDSNLVVYLHNSCGFFSSHARKSPISTVISNSWKNYKKCSIFFLQINIL